MEVDNHADDRRFPMWIEEMFSQFSSEGFKRVTVCEESVVVILNPIVNFDVLEGHQYISNFIFVCDFALVEVRSEILYELSEDCRRDSASSKNWCSFVGVVEFNSSHVVDVGVERCLRHCE